MKNKRLILAAFEVETFLKSAGAIDPTYLECMVQTSGRGDPEHMLAWWADISGLMDGDDKENLIRVHLKSKGMDQSEYKAIGYQLRGFWSRVKKNRSYHESQARRFYASR